MRMFHNLNLVLILFLNLVSIASAEKKDHECPPLVKAIEGDTITLTCDYGCVTEKTLYAVNGYKDHQELFRNYPNPENPLKVYKIDGVKLQLPLHSPWQVVLQNVNASASGKYTCMVVDYPRYRTINKSYQVEVTSKNESHQSDAPRAGISFNFCSRLQNCSFWTFGKNIIGSCDYFGPPDYWCNSRFVTLFMKHDIVFQYRGMCIGKESDGGCPAHWNCDLQTIQ